MAWRLEVTGKYFRARTATPHAVLTRGSFTRACESTPAFCRNNSLSPPINVAAALIVES
jgi:hypothetical protein